MEAGIWYFPLVLFIVLYMVFLNSEFVDEVLQLFIVAIHMEAVEKSCRTVYSYYAVPEGGFNLGVWERNLKV